MRITLFMACSLNGIIARPDYREDFLSREHWDGFLACARRTGALIWGRKTHEKCRRYGPQYLDAMKGLAAIVVTTDPGFALEPGFERAASPQDAVSTLEAKGLAEATLAGGSILNASFARAGLIDQVELQIEAVIIGRGIPIVAPGDFDLRLGPATVAQVTERILQVRCPVLELTGPGAPRSSQSG